MRRRWYPWRRNIVAKVFFVVLAAIVWVVFHVGKVLFDTAKWPVEIDRKGKHFGTRRAKDYGAAGGLRDGLVAQIQAGRLVSDQQASAA